MGPITATVVIGGFSLIFLRIIYILIGVTVRGQMSFATISKGCLGAVITSRSWI